jgi:hypothetical protein
MTPDTLTQIGEALYGRIWQAQICELLQIDSRRVRAWISGERSIPPTILPELVAELRRRGKRAIALADKL